MNTELVRFTTVGSVDDGKSTLIGRLLYDIGSILDDHLDGARRASKNGLDLALFTDGLRAEREQGITIDVAYRHFSTQRRRFILADSPGHEQYTANMVTGASTADIAIILVDVSNGVRPQTRRHAYLAWLLGIRCMCVIVNKMDKVGFRASEFNEICSAFHDIARNLPGCKLEFIPASALTGDNVVHESEKMPWHTGTTLLEFLDTVSIDNSTVNLPLRFPVQYVIRGADGRRLYAGQLAAGSVRLGDEVQVLPTTRRARVRSIATYYGDIEEAIAPMSVSLSLDGPVDVGRGHLIANGLRPPVTARSLEATLFWMGSHPLEAGESYLLRHTTQEVQSTVTALESVLNIGSLEYEGGQRLVDNGIGRVRIESPKPIFCDPYSFNRKTGSFILMDRISRETVAAGIIDHAEPEPPARARSVPGAGHGMVVWLTGLPSSGKTTIGLRVCEHLRRAGLNTELLDGDSIRQNLCKDLGFSRADREENVRRIGFVAGLLARNGVAALVSAIAPYRALRDEVRRQTLHFVEVYVNAPISVCEQRDVKGLYRKARNGELQQFTGIDDVYEPPLNPQVECHTDVETVEESSDKVIRYIEPLLAELSKMKSDR